MSLREREWRKSPGEKHDFSLKHFPLFSLEAAAKVSKWQREKQSFWLSVEKKYRVASSLLGHMNFLPPAQCSHLLSRFHPYGYFARNYYLEDLEGISWLYGRKEEAGNETEEWAKYSEHISCAILPIFTRATSHLEQRFIGAKLFRPAPSQLGHAYFCPNNQLACTFLSHLELFILENESGDWFWVHWGTEERAT